MVGLCGIIGPQNHDISIFSNRLCYLGDENQQTYTDGDVSIGYVEHEVRGENQPATVEDVSIWIWGEILGHEYKGNYTSKPNGKTDAGYCADLYENFGTSFVSGLNSDFAGILLDDENNTVSFFTDRLGSRPLYYTWADDGSLVFSSTVQSLVHHPQITPEFDPDFLSEFLHYGRSLGIYTPLKNVYQLPPASVVTFNKTGEKVGEWTYWWPNLSPKDKSFGAFVDEFTETLDKAVRERLSEEQPGGLLLSGGVDSRAILAASEGDLIGMHMNEPMERNKEEWVARRSAEITGAEFEFLKRHADYYPSVLKQIQDISNYNGIFTHAHAAGFSEPISTKADYLLCGQYSDTLIGTTYVPMSKGTPELIDNMNDYAQSFAGGNMGGHGRESPFSLKLPDKETVIRNNIHRRGSKLEYHGVSFPSWRSLSQFVNIYPISNARTFVFYESNTHMIPTRYPYLDNRIVDLVLQMPQNYRYQRDIVSESLNKLNPELASVESEYNHSYSELLQETIQRNKYLNHLLNTSPKRLPTDLLKFIGVMEGEISRPTSNSDTYLSRGSWPDKDGLIRCHPFVEDVLREHEESIRECPYLDFEEAIETYYAHLRGDNHRKELFSLLSLVETPAFETVY